MLGGYRLLRRLGTGGAGTVWLAEDGAGQRVALKLLHPALASTEEARRRLSREATTVNRVHSSGVARVLDVEVDDSQPFVVTEFVDGPTLSLRLRSGALAPREVAALADSLRHTLLTVHDAGVVHRDVKPSNVILNPMGPVLIDFGIAMAEDDERLTHTGLVSGTAGFTAPELLRGAPASVGTDWWSWAATVLEAATGRPPFGSGDPQAVMLRVMGGEPDTAGLPSGVARVLAGELAVDASTRPGPEAVCACLALPTSWRTAPTPHAGERHGSPPSVPAGPVDEGGSGERTTVLRGADGWDGAGAGTSDAQAATREGGTTGLLPAAWDGTPATQPMAPPAGIPAVLPTASPGGRPEALTGGPTDAAPDATADLPPVDPTQLSGATTVLPSSPGWGSPVWVPPPQGDLPPGRTGAPEGWGRMPEGQGWVPEGSGGVPQWYPVAPYVASRPRPVPLTGCLLMLGLAVLPVVLGSAGSAVVGVVLVLLATVGATRAGRETRRVRHQEVRPSDTAVALAGLPLHILRSAVALIGGLIAGVLVSGGAWVLLRGALFAAPPSLGWPLEVILSDAHRQWGEGAGPVLLQVVWGLTAVVLLVMWVLPTSRRLREGTAVVARTLLRPRWSRVVLDLLLVCVLAATWYILTGGGT